MNVIATPIPGALVVEPKVFADERGAFFESYSEQRYRDHGIPDHFVQDNVSRSGLGVLRGVHYQFPRPQAKLVSVVAGEIFDVVVDVRRGSPAFGRCHGVRLSAENRRQLYLPAGCAHGFQALAADSVCLIKVSDFYLPGAEHTFRWDDPAVGIEWPAPVLTMNERDRGAPVLSAIPAASLPEFAG
jgi:dTDP-4-dehydrorhamnose 3,5-epimerase